MPVYNGGALLAEALESALMQEYAPLEIVVVDNASTDDTRAIVERLAARDRRVRYLRNATNVGGVENARRVLAEARGTYFTWLFHDDLLCDPRYVDTVVDFLERTPNAAGCVTGFKLLNHELQNWPAEDPLHELRPDRPWSEVRREFFRWPQPRACALSVFAMYRRDEIIRATIRPIVFRGRRIIYQWEMAFLADVCGRGRIVSVPNAMRVYRASRTAAGQRLFQEFSPFDLVELALRTKLRLIRSALRAPIPFAERMSLLGIAVANLCRANIRQGLNVRLATRERTVRLGALRQAVRERSQLVEMLRGEIELRRAIIQAAGRDPGPVDTTDSDIAPECIADPGHVGAPAGRVRALPFRPLGAAREFFRPASNQEVDDFYSVNIESFREQMRADALLRQIQRLHSEAESLLEIINGLPSAPADATPRPGPPAPAG